MEFHPKNSKRFSIADISRADNESAQFFDNPLRKEFLTLPQVCEFFRYSEKWVRQQMGEGNLPFRHYGRDGVLFYVPDVRQAILDGSLAPLRKVQNDKNKKNKNRENVSGKSEAEGFHSLQELRQLQRS